MQISFFLRLKQLLSLSRLGSVTHRPTPEVKPATGINENYHTNTFSHDLMGEQTKTSPAIGRKNPVTKGAKQVVKHSR